MFSPSRHGADDGQTQIIMFLVHGKWLLLVRSAYTRHLVQITDLAYSSWRQNIIWKFAKGGLVVFVL